MDVVIGLAILFGIGWLVSKSRVLSALLDGFGLLMNWIWGSLFLLGGIWGLFHDFGVWQSLLCIGLGIYFFIPSRRGSRAEAAAEQVAAAFADRGGDGFRGAEPVAAGAACPQCGAAAAAGGAFCGSCGASLRA